MRAQGHGRIRLERYWSIDRLHPIGSVSLQDAAAEFRRLLHRSLRAAIDPAGRTWAHLSGGLDSSSIVSAAASLCEGATNGRALGGTITFADSLGNADEKVYVAAVLRRFEIRNERILDDWPWRSDGLPPPLTDEPSRDYPFHARDRLCARIVTDAGGSSLLSGVGPDDYLPHTAAHVPDLVCRGEIVEAMRQLHAWTMTTRGSLWHTLIEHVVVPLLLPRFQGRSALRGSEVATWFTKRFTNEFGLRDLLAEQHSSGVQRGFYGAVVARHLSHVAASLRSWLYVPGLELRHPFLYLPLVEFALRLPYDLRTDPYWSKPVLRSAMKGTLPEEVRQRSTKGILSPRIGWAFRKERQRLGRLVGSSVLADLGCIEPREILAAVDRADTLAGADAGYLYSILSLETWLSVRAGRYDVDRTHRLTRLNKEEVHVEARDRNGRRRHADAGARETDAVEGRNDSPAHQGWRRP